MTTTIPTRTDLSGDFKVADLSLAPWGRKEIELAEHEMPGLMAMPRGVRSAAAAASRAHRRLAAHDGADGRADRDPARARRRSELVAANA